MPFFNKSYYFTTDYSEDLATINAYVIPQFVGRRSEEQSETQNITSFSNRKFACSLANYGLLIAFNNRIDDTLLVFTGHSN